MAARILINTLHVKVEDSIFIPSGVRVTHRRDDYGIVQFNFNDRRGNDIQVQLHKNEDCKIKINTYRNDGHYKYVKSWAEFFKILSKLDKSI